MGVILGKITVLKSTKQRFFNKRIFGFDIETNNDNKNFVLASIYSDDYQKFYYTKKEFIDDIKTNHIFRNAVIFATNLSFDFFGMFFNHKESKNFYTLFRGSDLLFAKTHYYKNKFHVKGKVKSKQLKSLLFLDSMNYAKLSVKKMGEIINLDKLDKPACLGKKITSEYDLNQLKIYNLRDSEITYKFMKFLIRSFEKLGATFKNTIASTSMSLFKNKYLKEHYFQPDVNILLEQFESYYGGRTEALKRGYFEDKFYYDFNSLYPDVMRNKFPDPNTLRITNKNSIKYIKNYEGISKVDVYIFPCKYPLLPHRKDNGRVIFPCGNISGWYTHIELREAIKHGAVIKHIYKTHYYKETCDPFKEFVEDMYSLRKDYQKINSSMEYVVKIVMNSLYGKFGQKFIDRDNWVHEAQFTLSDLESHKYIERKGDYIRVSSKYSKPSAFCVPIWASYVTSYARIKLHRAILETEPIYCDTDSLITHKELKTSDKLGDLKLEMKILRGVVVRPKFYALQDKHNKDYVKIKGLGQRLNYLQFLGLLVVKYIAYDKFAKFKESLRRDLIPNQIIQTHKEFSLEDEKRLWKNKFSLEFEDSCPIMLTV